MTGLQTTDLPIWVSGVIAVCSMAVLAVGAHWVIESATRLSRRLGVSELVIGLTVVAFGTSAPEFAVTLIAAFKGQGDISVSNVVGSLTFSISASSWGAAP